jgi:ribonuclease P protein component
VFLVAAQPAVSADRAPTEVDRVKELPAARLGLVVTKKVGPAVARNRIKRVCRQCFRTWSDLIPRGVDLLVIAKSGADELGLEDVRREWGRVQRQLSEAARKAVANARKKTHVSGP